MFLKFYFIFLYCVLVRVMCIYVGCLSGVINDDDDDDDDYYYYYVHCQCDGLV